jgi:hypothetical protein
MMMVVLDVLDVEQRSTSQGEYAMIDYALQEYKYKPSMLVN